MKRHNLFKVVMLTILLMVVLSWIIPQVSIDSYGTLNETGSTSPVGIFLLMNYVGEAIHYFWYVGFYVLVVGGLYGVFHKIPAYRALIDKIVGSFKNKEWIVIAVLMLFIAGVAAFANMQLAIIVLFPFVISVVLAMGYDRITAGLATCGAVCAGLMGTALSLNTTYGVDAFFSLSSRSNLKIKLLVFVIAVGLMIGYTIFYAKKHRTHKDENNSLFVPEELKKKNVRIWPLVVAFDLLLAVLIIGFISWQDPLKINLFSDLFEKANSFSVLSVPIFKNLFGLQNAFGTWTTLVEASVVVILASWLISFIYKIKFSDYLSCFMDGCEKALKAAVLVVLIYTVLVIVVFAPYTLAILKPIIGLTDTLNVFTMSLTAFLGSVFGIDSYYAALGTGALPYVNTVYTNLASSDITLIALIWQTMYGLAMLVAPTSVVLMATLSYLNIPYQKWLKGVWKIFLIILIVLLAMFLIMAAL